MISVIFDLDGTLIDSAPDIHRVANEVLALEGLPQIGSDQARSFIGEGLPVFVARALGAVGEPTEGPRHARMLSAFTSRYLAGHPLTTLYPHVRESLRALAEAGHPLGLCTNKPIAPTRLLLDAFGLAEVFGAVVGGDSLAVRKPDPAPLLAARDGLGSARAVFVGDSETDAETALRAGIPFLLFTQGYRKSPAEALPQAARFDRFDALPALVARIAAA